MCPLRRLARRRAPSAGQQPLRELDSNRRPRQKEFSRRAERGRRRQRRSRLLANRVFRARRRRPDRLPHRRARQSRRGLRCRLARAAARSLEAVTEDVHASRFRRRVPRNGRFMTRDARAARPPYARVLAPERATCDGASTHRLPHRTRVLVVEMVGVHRAHRTLPLLDSCQCATMLRARRPRADCPDRGAGQAGVPWTERPSAFPAVFERFAIDVVL